MLSGETGFYAIPFTKARNISEMDVMCSAHNVQFSNNDSIKASVIITSAPSITTKLLDTFKVPFRSTYYLAGSISILGYFWKMGSQICTVAILGGAKGNPLCYNMHLVNIKPC